MPRKSVLDSPKAFENFPEPPAAMSAREKQLWRETIRCRPAATWPQCDLALLKLYVETLADVEETKRALRKEGDLVWDEQRGTRVNPRFAVLATREKTFVSLATKLKLSTASRWTSKEATQMDRYGRRQANSLAVLHHDDEGLLGGALQ